MRFALSNSLIEAHDLFVERIGFFGTLFGFSKLIGQIYGELYLSPTPLNLNNLMGKLHVSKGSVSVNIRELEKLGGCKKVWVKGDRKDYYEAETNFSDILGEKVLEALRWRISTFGGILRITSESIVDKGKNFANSEEEELIGFYRERLQKIEDFRQKIDILINSIGDLLARE